MPENINLLDKKLWLFKRARSPLWQMRYAIKKNEWQTKSTGEAELEKAKQIAIKFYYSAEEREAQGRPAVSRSFRVVAKAAIARMENEVKSGEGKVSYNDYIRVINKLLIPYFKSKVISDINSADLKAWALWRDEQLANDRLEKAKQAALNRAKTAKDRKAINAMQPDIKPAAKSTVNTHNAALNRILDEAEINGWVTKSTRPKLPNKGRKPTSRGAFTEEEYIFIEKQMWKWANTGRQQSTRELRELLAEYVGFLAGTGVRSGTEAYNLKWKNIEEHRVKGQRPFVIVNVDGKRGERELVATDMATVHLVKLLEINPRINEMKITEALKAKIDEYVFVDRSGNRVSTDSLRQSFRQFLIKHDLRVGANGKNRSLYSLRHTYATLALIDGRNIYQLAKQLGTSVKMIEEYYSKASVRQNAIEHSGRTKYDLPPMRPSD